jgi:hypothetical protein
MYKMYIWWEVIGGGSEGGGTYQTPKPRPEPALQISEQ